MINNGHIGLHYLRNLKRKANEATNNPCGPAAGIGGSVCVNYLWPVEAGGGGMKDEALDLALEALEGVVKNCWRDIPSWRLDEIKERITAIKQALAAPTVQEPVAWMQPDEVHISLWKDDYHTIPLYTTPPAAQRQWVGLTEQEAAECWSTSTVRTWQAIEAKLKAVNGFHSTEKNT